MALDARERRNAGDVVIKEGITRSGKSRSSEYCAEARILRDLVRSFMVSMKDTITKGTTTSIVGERQFFLAPEGHTHTIPDGSLRRKPVAQTVSWPKGNFRGGCESGLRAEAPEALPRSAQDLSP